MRHLLEQALEHLDSAGGKWQRRDYAGVRWQYLKSAECLFQSPAQSDSRLRHVRIEKAEQLLDIARRLPASTSSQTKGLTEVVAADDRGSRFVLRELAEIRFAEVAGLKEAKHQIRLPLIYPLEHPEKAARYGIKRGGGVFLYGAPGTGKTLLARAVAGENRAAFFTAKPSDLMSKWVGESEQNVARLFEEARCHELAIIFLDEVEPMIPARRCSDSTVMQRVVPQILAELRGIHNKSANLLFLGATDEPWAIDPAALCPGRFDAKVNVGLPEPAARRQMLDLYLARRPLAADVNLDRLVESLAGYSGADITELCDRTAASVFMESIQNDTKRPITTVDIQYALRTIEASVSALELKKYENWPQRRRVAP